MSDLEPFVTGWVEDVTGGRVASVVPVTAGGRLGFALDVERGGETLALFLQRGRQGGDPSFLDSFLDLEREAEVYRAVRPLGVPVPEVWGVDNGRNVLLVDRMPGSGWFQTPRDPDEARSIARDFVTHLATWHRVPARDLDLPSFGPIRTIAEHQRDQVAAIRVTFEAQDRRAPIDALAWLMLDILEHRRPDHDGEPVLLQGDTGPGNLLHADGRVTAVLDWELAHVGDPMDDIAWLSWRATQHGFPDFPERMREYEAASGHPVDAARVAYYRVNAVARLGPLFGVAEMGTGRAPGADVGSTVDAAIDRNADGSWRVMSMLHRRMRLEAIGAAVALDLPGRDVDGEDDPLDHAGLFDGVLDTLQQIVGRSDDRGVWALAKGAARNVKYLKELDRNGRRFAARELDDIAGLLGRSPASVTELAEARRALAGAARAGTVPVEEYLLYHWRRMVHDDHLLRTASGALFERSWPSVV